MLQSLSGFSDLAASHAYFGEHLIPVPLISHEKGLKLSTIAMCYTALKDLLFYGFQLALDPHLMDLIRKDFFRLALSGPSRRCLISCLLFRGVAGVLGSVSDSFGQD